MKQQDLGAELLFDECKVSVAAISKFAIVHVHV